MSPYVAGVIFSLASALFWAVGVVLFKKSGDEIPPLTLNIFKNLVALALCVPAALIFEGTLAPSITGRQLLLYVISGVVGITISDTLFFMALNRLGAGLNAVVDCLYSPSMIFLSWLFLRDVLPAPLLVGAGIILLGVLLSAGSRPIEGRTRRDVLVGILLGAAGMVLVAVSIVIIKRELSGDRVFFVVGLRVLVGLPLLLPLALLRGEGAILRRVLVPSRLWRFALPASLCGGFVAMSFWVAGMTDLPVSRSAILNQLSTIFIFLLAAAVLKEPVTWRRVLALALSFGGAVLVLTT